MKRIPLFIVVIMVLSVCANVFAQDAPADDGWVEGDLKYKASTKDMDGVIFPGTDYISLEYSGANYLPILNPQADKRGYLIVIEDKGSIKFDSKGNGNTDTTINKKDQTVQIKLPTADGSSRSYHLRFYQEGTKWQGEIQVPDWRVGKGCFVEGKIGGETIKIFDDTLNGQFNDFGKDSMVIGKWQCASFLSNTIIVKNKIYEIRIEGDGSKIWSREVQMPAGKLDVVSKFSMKGESPKALIIQSGKMSFNVVGKDKVMEVPAGKYKFISGIINEKVFVRGHNFPDFEIVEGETLVLEWGGPFRMEADAYLAYGGETYTIIPPAEYTAPQRNAAYLDCPFIKMDNHPKVVGDKGEEYYAPDKYKDAYGYGFADTTVERFEVKIHPFYGNEPDMKAKPLNAKGYIETDAWAMIQLSGLIQKGPKWWSNYQCPIENYKGKVLFIVTAKSKVFGDLKHESVIDVQ